MMRRRRKAYEPSSSHKLARIAESAMRAYGGTRAERIERALKSDYHTLATLSGPAGSDWAMAQLLTPPHVAKGWPRPCKAARTRLRVPKPKGA